MQPALDGHRGQRQQQRDHQRDGETRRAMLAQRSVPHNSTHTSISQHSTHARSSSASHRVAPDRTAEMYWPRSSTSSAARSL